MAVYPLQVNLHLLACIAQLPLNGFIKVFLSKEVAHMSQLFEYKLSMSQFLFKRSAFSF